MIIVDARAGLANRMRAVVSGMILAERLGVPVRVEWAPTKACAATHDDLFQNSASDIFGTDQPSATGETLWGSRWRRGKILFFDQTVDRYQPQVPVDIPQAVLQDLSGDVRIQCFWNYKDAGMTNADFYQRYGELLNQHFLPIGADPEAEALATYGMHIRCGDKRRPWVSGSPSRVGRCEREIRRLLARGPATTVLLCSDDAGVKQSITASLGDRVRTLPDPTLKRDDLQGMRFAARELYELGRVSEIFGDGDSSFGPTAAQYRRVPYRNLASRFGLQLDQTLATLYKRFVRRAAVQ